MAPRRKATRQDREVITRSVTEKMGTHGEFPASPYDMQMVVDTLDYLCGAATRGAQIPRQYVESYGGEGDFSDHRLWMLACAVSALKEVGDPNGFIDSDRLEALQTLIIRDLWPDYPPWRGRSVLL